MPLPVDSLNKDSSPEQIRAAINSSYEKCMKEGGRTAKECGGYIYGVAREKTGKELGSHGESS
jgi:hypothetical protein